MKLQVKLCLLNLIYRDLLYVSLKDMVSNQGLPKEFYSQILFSLELYTAKLRSM